MWGAYFCMGAYKCDVVVVIKLGAYVHGVLILCGCLLSRFYGNVSTNTGKYQVCCRLYFLQVCSRCNLG